MSLFYKQKSLPSIYNTWKKWGGKIIDKVNLICYCNKTQNKGGSLKC